MANILLIEHGGPLKRFTIEKLHNKGLSVFIACTKKPDWLEDLVPSTNIIICDTYNSIQLLEAVSSYMQLKSVVFEAVGTFWESCVVQAADIAAALNLPNIGSGPARRSSQNKLLMREFTSNAGINSPKYKVASLYDWESMASAASIIGFPLVIKPLNGSSSYGIKKVLSLEDLESAINDVKKSITEDNEEIFKLFSGTVLLEEYVSGNLYSIDGLVYEESVKMVGIVEFIMGPEPYFTQVGSIIRPYPVDFKSKMLAFVSDVIKVLGFKNGAFHCEIRLSNDNKPFLIEIAARMPGGPLALGYEQVFGFSYVNALADIWLGKEPSVKLDFQKYSMHKCVFAHNFESLKIKSISGLNLAKEHAGIWDFISFAENNSVLKGYPEVPDPIYYYAVKADDETTLQKYAAEIESVVQLEVYK
jgi:biotin carboxylase